MKTISCKVLSLFLVFVMLCGILPIGQLTALAEEKGNKTVLPVPSGLSWDWDERKVRWNAVPGASSYEIEFIILGYGSQETFEVSSEKTEYDFTLKYVGNYYFSVKALGDDTSTQDSLTGYSDLFYCYNSGRSQVKLDMPTGLTWDGTTAKWDDNGNARGYRFQLYKTGVDDPVDTELIENVAELDYQDKIAYLGEGTYYYTVQAKGDGWDYDSSDVSGKSPTFTYDTDNVKARFIVTDNDTNFLFEVINSKEVMLTYSSSGSKAASLNIPEAQKHSRYNDNVSIPSTVKLGDSTFDVTTIGLGAFSGLDITSVKLPSSIKKIDDCAFDTKYLTDITFEGTTPPLEIGTFQAFSSYKIFVHIPAGTKSAYETALSDYINEFPYDITLQEATPQLHAPTDIAWKSTAPCKATWKAVGNANGYNVQLKDSGGNVGNPIKVTTGVSYDFTQEIKNNGYSSYTFTVVALGDGKTTLDSEESKPSGVYLYDEYTGKDVITNFIIDEKPHTVGVGTDLAELDLPKKINVTLRDDSYRWVNITQWKCQEKEYDPNTVGTYVFKPILDYNYDGGEDYVKSGFKVDKNVTLPEIKIILKDSVPGGSGTQYDPYLISTADELKNIIKDDEEVYYKLSADITEPITEPIGDQDNMFSGTFDGAGHTVTLNIDTNVRDAALFGCIPGSATIKNLKVTGSVRNKSSILDLTAAGVVGCNYGIIENCSAINCTISSEPGDTGCYPSAGGIVGYDYSGSITGCYASGTVDCKLKGEDESYAGGIVGTIYCGTVNDCAAYVNVEGNENSESSFVLGGLAGSSCGGKITNCCATGNVSANGAGSIKAGGFIGTLCQNSDVNSKVKDCYSAGDVSSSLAAGVTGECYLGGFSGYVESECDVSDCYFNNSNEEWYGYRSDYSTGSAEGKSTDQLLNSDFVDQLNGSADEDYFWKIVTDKNEDYPMPVWRTVSSEITKVTMPVTGGTPVTSISTEEYDAVISWSSDNVTLSAASKFEAGKQYTATINIAPKPYNNLNGVTKNYFVVNNALSAKNTKKSGLVTAVFPVTVKAPDAGGNVITGFLLDNVIKSKQVENGTAFADLNLPDKLKAVGSEITGLWVKISKWVSDVTYNPNVARTYTFTPVFDNKYVDSGYVDSGYVLINGIQLPEIKVTVKAKPSSNNQSDRTSSDTSTKKPGNNQTETKVDPLSNTATVTTKPESVTTNGNTASMEAVVPSVVLDNTQSPTAGSTVDTGKKAAVMIQLPSAEIKEQLAAKKDVELTVTVPSDVARDTNANVALSINANKEILEAAKKSLSDVTIKIKDAGTQQLAYSWTFRGEDLAKSKVPVTDVNIAMSVHLTTEVPKVNAITPDKTGMVLSFDHSGELPSVASVTISALEKGFKPGQTLYFYYYNPTTKQIESLGKDAYTVDAQGNVTVQISHCSDYVLLPNAARSLTLDTKTYQMPLGGSYEIGVKRIDAKDTTVKVYSSTKGVANVVKLKNGNYRVTAKKAGLTYIMFDVYDKKGKLIVKSHASVRLTVKKGIVPNGDSRRQTAIF